MVISIKNSEAEKKKRNERFTSKHLEPKDATRARGFAVCM